MGFTGDWLEPALSLLAAATPSQLCLAYFVLSSGLIGPAALLPSSLRKLVLDYGARYSDKKKDHGKNTDGPKVEQQTHEFIAKLTSLTQVPHAWFATFYGTSLTCCFFWLWQYLSNGSVLRSIATQQAKVSSSTSTMSMQQVALVWALMVLQAGRRLYEHVVITKPSKSTMWAVHWLLGVSYYACLSVAIWIEGSRAILTEPVSSTTLGVPSPRTALGVAGFLFAWFNQAKCHRYLFGLKKYSLPNEGMFRYFVCPHYTCECLLYLSLAFVAAPSGTVWNKTLLGNLLFVVVNLGATASGTRKWYIEKFGSGPLVGKWNMIPYVF